MVALYRHKLVALYLEKVSWEEEGLCGKDSLAAFVINIHPLNLIFIYHFFGPSPFPQEEITPQVLYSIYVFNVRAL